MRIPVRHGSEEIKVKECDTMDSCSEESKNIFNQLQYSLNLYTHLDESMKYITRAPMLRAKTVTTCAKETAVLVFIRPKYSNVQVKHTFKWLVWKKEVT